MEKLKTLLWFAQRPAFYPHMLALTGRKLRGAAALEANYEASLAWATDLAVDREAALRAAGLPDIGEPGVPSRLLEQAADRVRGSGVVMGGAGDLDLIFQAIVRSRARRVVETGVAYGWSSLAALAALEATDGRLVSVDMPYPKADSEAFVGVAVPDALRARWTLIREPDRNGLKKALRRFDGAIDLCHYDSDKSYPGRMFAYPLLWDALQPGGLFISDDIQDNFAFRDFCAARHIAFAVTESEGKFVGIARKPG
jgi:predicted O-methyltransferase YrrM